MQKRNSVENTEEIAVENRRREIQLKKYRREIQLNIEDRSQCVTVELIDACRENPKCHPVSLSSLILNYWTFLIFQVLHILRGKSGCMNR